MCLHVCLGVCVFACLSSSGHEPAVVPGGGPRAAVPAALPAGRHPEEEERSDLGEHPARPGPAHLAAVPQDGRAGLVR